MSRVIGLSFRKRCWPWCRGEPQRTRASSNAGLMKFFYRFPCKNCGQNKEKQNFAPLFGLILDLLVPHAQRWSFQNTVVVKWRFLLVCLARVDSKLQFFSGKYKFQPRFRGSRVLLTTRILPPSNSRSLCGYGVMKTAGFALRNRLLHHTSKPLSLYFYLNVFLLVWFHDVSIVVNGEELLDP